MAGKGNDVGLSLKRPAADRHEFLSSRKKGRLLIGLWLCRFSIFSLGPVSFCCVCLLISRLSFFFWGGGGGWRRGGRGGGWGGGGLCLCNNEINVMRSLS